uniref:Uncharacterized protein n=1 Tax=Rhizophagus irregularis (strain DAOM 181602 / DAOM 197198 / MUCL 43194) TaxID=747089 RepID=U9U0R7_RHIID
MQSQIQNFGKPTINSTSFTTNTPFSPQLDNTLNVSSYINDARDIPVAIDNMLQVSPIITQLSMPPTQLNMNENQAFNIQEMIPRHTLQPMQVYQQMPLQSPHPPLLTHSQKTDIISEYSFFYAPCNDFQTYHIICKEIPFNFESRFIQDYRTYESMINSNTYIPPNHSNIPFPFDQSYTSQQNNNCQMVSSQNNGNTFFYWFL